MAPTIGRLALDNGFHGSIPEDWVAPPPQNIHSACKRPPILLRSSAEAVFEISIEKESFRMITSGLNAADDTMDCSGNLNSTKSTDGSAGILTDLTAGGEVFLTS